MIGMILYLLISLAVGILSCFWGRKFYYPVIAVYAFIVTFSLCGKLMGAGVAGVIIAIIIGLLAALLSKFFYKAGVFIISFLLGLVLGIAIAFLISPVFGGLTWIIVVAIALIVGIVAVKFCDIFIMIATSFGGASLVASTITFVAFNISRLKEYVGMDIEALSANVENYIKNTSSVIQKTIFAGLFVILGIWGLIYQIKKNK